MPSLLRLTYASTARFEPVDDGRGIEVAVARILMESRRNNPRRRIGGVLHYGDGFFFQCLEGPRDDVNEVYRKIAADERHRDVELLSAHQPSARIFGRWSMKYVPVESVVKRLIARHGLAAFRPYEFNPQLIRELLKACILEEDPTATGADRPRPRDGRTDAQGLWTRLKDRLGAGLP